VETARVPWVRCCCLLRSAAHLLVVDIALPRSTSCRLSLTLKRLLSRHVLFPQSCSCSISGRRDYLRGLVVVVGARMLPLLGPGISLVSVGVWSVCQLALLTRSTCELECVDVPLIKLPCPSVRVSGLPTSTSPARHSFSVSLPSHLPPLSSVARPVTMLLSLFPSPSPSNASSRLDTRHLCISLTPRECPVNSNRLVLSLL
jgi:hypothetical protein